MIRDSRIGTPSAFFVLQCTQHSLALILIRPPQPVRLIDAEAVPLRVGQRPRAKLRLDLGPADLLSGMQPVKAVGSSLSPQERPREYDDTTRGRNAPGQLRQRGVNLAL